MPTLTFTFLFLSFTAALTQPESWRDLRFDRVTPNKITFPDSQIAIEVAQSASPLLHLFPTRKNVTTLRVTGTVSGNWNVPMGESWAKSPDDALLRIGLIENGSRRLNPLERIAAPGWIKEIETLSASVADGIGTIRCFHLMPADKWIGETRENPNASIFFEKIVAAPDEKGAFSIIVQLEEPVDTLGLWLLSDGDDSESEFTVKIDEIEVGVAQ